MGTHQWWLDLTKEMSRHIVVTCVFKLSQSIRSLHVHRAYSIDRLAEITFSGLAIQSYTLQNRKFLNLLTFRLEGPPQSEVRNPSHGRQHARY